MPLYKGKGSRGDSSSYKGMSIQRGRKCAKALLMGRKKIPPCSYFTDVPYPPGLRGKHGAPPDFISCWLQQLYSRLKMSSCHSRHTIHNFLSVFPSLFCLPPYSSTPQAPSHSSSHVQEISFAVLLSSFPSRLTSASAHPP